MTYHFQEVGKNCHALEKIKDTNFEKHHVFQKEGYLC